MSRNRDHWENPDNWTAGIIYHCPEDTRYFVPKGWKWGGWTINFSHPKAWFAGLGAIAIAVGPATLVMRLTGNRSLWLLAMLVLIIALCMWAHNESSKE